MKYHIKASLTLILLLLISTAPVLALHIHNSQRYNEFHVDKWNKVYLASFPRSGNHWTRYLIEEASGIATSSIYRDGYPPHLDRIFPWGGYCPDRGFEGNRRYPNPNETVILKTHQDSKVNSRTYSAVIRIIRHPIDSFYSQYVQFYRGNNRIVEPLISRDFLLDAIRQWKSFQNYWNPKPNVVIFRYEDMLEDPFSALKLMMDICHYPYNDEDIARAVAKYPPKGHMLKHLPHYTEDDLKLIRKELGHLMKKYGYEI